MRTMTRMSFVAGRSMNRVFLSLLLIPLLGGAHILCAADASPKKLTIAYSSISGSMAPLWVTHEAGIFRRHGLDVELVFLEGGSKAVEALASGEILVAQVGAAGALQSNLKGSDVVMIAGVLNTMPYQLMVAKNIKSPDQLKGKTLAVSRFGGSSDFATRYALEKYELVPQKDVKILEIGSQPDRIAALKEGKIHGAMLSIPKTLEAKQAGFSSLADLKMLGLEYQHTGLATTRKAITSQPEVLRNIMKAYVEGVHYYKTHRAESLRILQKYLVDESPEDLAETYEALALTLVPEKPYPTVRGIQLMLQGLSKRYSEAKNAPAERFVDKSLVEELDASGFIDSLYKKTTVIAEREAKSQIIAEAPRESKAPTPSSRPEKSSSASRGSEHSGEVNVSPARTPPSSLPPPRESNRDTRTTAVLKNTSPQPFTFEKNREPASVASAQGPNPLAPDGPTKLDKATPADKATGQASSVPQAAQKAHQVSALPKRVQSAEKTTVGLKPAMPAGNVSEPGGEPAREHTIVAGDTLSHLALQYYGRSTTELWMKIYEANRNVLKNPHYIFIGQTILIPPEERVS